jgi:hypothetical protein
LKKGGMAKGRGRIEEGGRNEVWQREEEGVGRLTGARKEA